MFGPGTRDRRSREWLRLAAGMDQTQLGLAAEINHRGPCRGSNTAGQGFRRTWLLRWRRRLGARPPSSRSRWISFRQLDPGCGYADAPRDTSINSSLNATSLLRSLSASASGHCQTRCRCSTATSRMTRRSNGLLAKFVRLLGAASGAVVGNVMRAAERLGCILLPMPDELGRHLGDVDRRQPSPNDQRKPGSRPRPGRSPALHGRSRARPLGPAPRCSTSERSDRGPSSGRGPTGSLGRFSCRVTR